MSRTQTQGAGSAATASTDSAIIRAEGISKSFGTVRALDGVDLKVQEGTILGLLGPNGAGKTTLVRILTTLLHPDAGKAWVAGHDVLDEPHAVRRAIGLAGQSAAVDELLTGRQNVEMVARLYGLDRRESRQRASDLLDRLGLTDAADRLVRGYSGGMRRRLDLGASLVGHPRVLVLDEPTTGLDPRTRNDVWKLIADLVSEGTTVLLTTQYLEEADRLADRIVVIDTGKVIAEGTSDELKAQLGADVVEVRLTNPEQSGRALEALARLDGGSAHWNEEERMISFTSGQGTSVLLDALRLLDGEQIILEDAAMRRPSLDDVFLALTGHGAVEEEPVYANGRQRRKERR
jgi:ABC-2 type transport system ATP-binding protein